MFLQIGCFLIVGILGHLEGHPVILQGRHKRHPYNSSNTFARGVWKKKPSKCFYLVLQPTQHHQFIERLLISTRFPHQQKKLFHSSPWISGTFFETGIHIQPTVGPSGCKSVGFLVSIDIHWNHGDPNHSQQEEWGSYSRSMMAK